MYASHQSAHQTADVYGILTRIHCLLYGQEPNPSDGPRRTRMPLNQGPDVTSSAGSLSFGCPCAQIYLCNGARKGNVPPFEDQSEVGEPRKPQKKKSHATFSQPASKVDE